MLCIVVKDHTRLSFPISQTKHKRYFFQKQKEAFKIARICSAFVAWLDPSYVATYKFQYLNKMVNSSCAVQMTSTNVIVSRLIHTHRLVENKILMR